MPSEPPDARGQHAADPRRGDSILNEHQVLATASGVVSNYGDPQVSWSIVLDADLGEPLDYRDVESRLASVVSAHRHLGLAPKVRVTSADEAHSVVQELANAPYVDDHLVRCMLTGDGLRLAVAAHHGAVDGLGLVALLGAALDEDLRSSARGLHGRRKTRSFYVRSMSRLIEAIVAPPGHFPTSGSKLLGDADHLEERQLTGEHLARTLATVKAVATTYDQYAQGRRPRVAVLAVGASTRDPSKALTPDRETAFLRVRVKQPDNVEEVLRLCRAEPDFPSSPAGGGAVPRVVQLLGARLGATATVSNLGRVQAHHGSTRMSALRFFPTPAGYAGLAVGSATVGDSTTLTVRGRSRYFSQDAVSRIADVVVSNLAGQYGS